MRYVRSPAFVGAFLAIVGIVLVRTPFNVGPIGLSVSASMMQLLLTGLLVALIVLVTWCLMTVLDFGQTWTIILLVVAIVGIVLQVFGLIANFAWFPIPREDLQHVMTVVLGYSVVEFLVFALVGGISKPHSARQTNGQPQRPHRLLSCTRSAV